MPSRTWLSPGACEALLESSLPRILGQIDRDPDSPTFGSCDRNFWMYRLRDFESGVVRQASLTLAVAAEVREGGERHLGGSVPNEHLRSVARAVNRRNVDALADDGRFDEYYPGERSYPGTVFAAHATLRSALMMQQRSVLDHPGLERCAESLLARSPGPAANQDIAAAAFLAAYAREAGWKQDRARRQVTALLDGPDGRGLALEYGGGDLGYATVSLHYLADMVDAGTFDAGERLVDLGRFITDFISARGDLGGEYPSRSTTYWLPYGLAMLASQVPELVPRIARLDLSAMWRKLDDRYVMHYCSPSLALAARSLAGGEPFEEAHSRPLDGWFEADHRARGLWAAHGPGASVCIGLDKGGTLSAQWSDAALIDCGYRITRGDHVYSTSALAGDTRWTHRRVDQTHEFEIEAGFHRYKTLTPSPAKTVALRGLKAFGPTLNDYFKRRLITDAERLDGPTLLRRIVLRPEAAELVIEDEVRGLGPDDRLFVAPPVSPRVVPSARFWQRGDGMASEAWCEASPHRSRTFRLTPVDDEP